MRITMIVGARPQFVKASVMYKALRKKHDIIVVHTGQHYDDNMSRIFFEELDMPVCDINLNIGSGKHGEQTGAILAGVEQILCMNKPDTVMVFGDTNSTIAGTLAASKLLIPVAHVEAGLRSFDKRMPEEQNRICTDHLSDMLFCPTQSAVEWLAKESITRHVYNVGDVMYDVVLQFSAQSEQKYGNDGFRYLTKLYESTITPKKVDNWYLATIHRAENTRDHKILEVILSAFEELQYPLIFPVHPRIRGIIDNLHTSNQYRNIIFCEPVGYTLMNWLAKRSIKILTDSGGLQKEAYMLGIPCITLSDTTSWIETLEGQWNILTPEISVNEILSRVQIKPNAEKRDPVKHFGAGNASEKIADLMEGIFFIKDRRRD